MVTIREEQASDAAAREALLDAAYGPARFAKTSERLREGRQPACGLSLVAVDGGRIVGTVRLWHVTAGPAQPALLLGPLAVHPDHRSRGIGSTAGAPRHRARTHRGPWRDPAGRRRGLLRPLWLLRPMKTGSLWMPGPFERHRLLGARTARPTRSPARAALIRRDRPNSQATSPTLPNTLIAEARGRRAGVSMRGRFPLRAA